MDQKHLNYNVVEHKLAPDSVKQQITSNTKVAGSNPIDRPLTRIWIQSGLQDYHRFDLTEVFMTIKLSGKLNSQRKRSMVATIVLSDVVQRQSISLSEILLLHTLYDSLGSGDLSRCQSEKIAQTVILIEGVLMAFAKAWLPTLDTTVEFPKPLLLWYKENLPNNTTIASWRDQYDPSKLSKARIVRVDQEFRHDGFDNFDRDSERYSGYSKGYDDHGGTPAPGKTRMSAELDGEEPLEQVKPPWFGDYTKLQGDLRSYIRKIRKSSKKDE